MSEDLPARQICDRFDLGEPTALSALGGTRNRNFVLQTSQGKWIARRRHESYCDPARIEFDHCAAAFLAERGAAVTPPLKDVHGSTFWSGGAGVWEVYRFVEGRHLADGRPDDVATLAQALSRFHSVGREFPLRFEKIGPRGETDPGDLSLRMDRIESESPNTSHVLAAYRTGLAAAASELSESDYASLPHTLVHGDVQPANLLMNNGKVAAFVDLDWMAWRPRIYDLGWAILCCCASHETPIGEGDIWRLSQSPKFDRDTVNQFLETYEGDTPLTPAERTALGPQLALTWIHIRVGLALKAPALERREFLERENGAEVAGMVADLGRG